MGLGETWEDPLRVWHGKTPPTFGGPSDTVYSCQVHPQLDSAVRRPAEHRPSSPSLFVPFHNEVSCWLECCIDIHRVDATHNNTVSVAYTFQPWSPVLHRPPERD